MDVWAADGRAGLTWQSGGRQRRMGAPGTALCRSGGLIFCAGPEACAVYDAARGEQRAAFAVPGGVSRLCCFGGLLCALSGDANSVTGYSLRTGAPVFASPAGSWPRGMAVSPDGRHLAVAGGQAACLIVLDGALRPVARYPLPGPALDVCFFRQGLAALCAQGEDVSRSSLIALAPGGAAEEIAAFPYAPACLCGLPSGHCLVGCAGQVMGIRADGSLFFRRPCGYPQAIRADRRGILLCDSLRGEARLMGGRLLFRSDDLRDALITP